jgi:hypothetical protein
MPLPVAAVVTTYRRTAAEVAALAASSIADRKEAMEATQRAMERERAQHRVRI